MTYLVYILYSESKATFYTGQTQDIVNRIEQHNRGQTKSIVNGIPWKLVWSEAVNSRSEAMKLENKVKKRGARRFLADKGISF